MAAAICSSRCFSGLLADRSTVAPSSETSSWEPETSELKVQRTVPFLSTSGAG
jgi:hypothetical protein